MIVRVLVLTAALGGAVATSQIPEFMQQYRQRLGGAVDELRRVVEDFDADVASEGLTRDLALDRYGASADPFIHKRGTSMTRTLVRFDRISDHRQALIDSTAFERPALLMQYGDRELVAGTLAEYRPAVPTTPEGAVYAAFGFLLGGGMMRMVLAAIGMGRRWLTGRRAA